MFATKQKIFKILKKIIVTKSHGILFLTYILNCQLTAEQQSERASTTDTAHIDFNAWTKKLTELNEVGWREAFAVGQELASLPPDTGFEILKNNWNKITKVDARQQLLKAFFFALPYPLHQRSHSRLLDVLNLGATDSSTQVQNWAFGYLERIAFQDFTEDYIPDLKNHPYDL